MINNSELLDVLEAPLESLMDLEMQLKKGDFCYYVCALRLYYLKSDLLRLDHLIERIQSDPMIPCRQELLSLAILKKSIRTGTDLELSLEKMKKYKFKDNSPLSADQALTEAIAYEVLGNDRESESSYRAAFVLCKKFKLHKRAASAYQNIIAALSRINPDLRLVYEYNHAASLAIKAGSFGTAGTAYSNLSREYYRMGALKLALHIVAKAMEFLHDHQYGTYQYYFALCNQCQYRLEVGRYRDAELSYEDACLSNHDEIISTLRVLAQKAKLCGLNWKPPHVKREILVLTWKERSNEQPIQSVKKLSNLEMNVVTALSEKPMASYDLIERIYPKSGSFFIRENRLKQLIFRLRKKCPGLILNDDGMYSLAR